MNSDQRLRPSERIELIDRIGRELQSRYTFNDMDMYFGAFGIARLEHGDRGSKWVYTKQALHLAEEPVILQIAADLGLIPPTEPLGDQHLPRNWVDTLERKVFLSHLSRSKDKATRLKHCLAPYGINLFIAHEDIHPTLEWQREIVRALRSMDSFISLHTPGFSSSFWCQQEVGYALSRSVPMVAIRMGEDPVGFQSARQALSRGRKTAEELSREIAELWSCATPASVQ